MAYASRDDLDAFLEGRTDLRGSDDPERLLTEAESMVDRLTGWPAPDEAGPRIDLNELTGYQADALKKATLAACEWLLALDPDELIGTTDFAPGEVTVIQRAGRVPPRVVEQLSGSGLLKHAGTVMT
jgi:hypothetical protein